MCCGMHSVMSHGIKLIITYVDHVICSLFAMASFIWLSSCDQLDAKVRYAIVLTIHLGHMPIFAIKQRNIVYLSNQRNVNTMNFSWENKGFVKQEKVSFFKGNVIVRCAYCWRDSPKLYTINSNCMLHWNQVILSMQYCILWYGLRHRQRIHRFSLDCITIVENSMHIEIWFHDSAPFVMQFHIQYTCVCVCMHIVCIGTRYIFIDVKIK